jgi:elongation factor Ts
LLAAKGNAVRRFIRFEVGEGIEVEAQDFAAEVAAQVQGTD